MKMSIVHHDWMQQSLMLIISSKTTLFLIVNLAVSQLTTTAASIHQIPLIPHQQILNRHRSLLEGSKGSNLAHQQIDSLYQGYGTHYVDLWVGTPPQRQTVIVGTDSPYTAFPCSACHNCGELYHTDAYFMESDSSTYRELTNCNCGFGYCDHNSDQKCMLTAMYGEGSMWKGIESIDITYAGGPHSRLENQGAIPSVFSEYDTDEADPLRASQFAFDHSFGCQVEATGLFRSQMADGMMGMNHSPEAFWHQAYDAGVIDKKAFALCLSKPDVNPSKSGTEAGALTMGGYDDRLHTSKMVYTTMDRERTMFAVMLRRIYMQNSSSGVGGREDGSIVVGDNSTVVEALDVDDSIYSTYHNLLLGSGTTDTYLPRGLGLAFRTAWEKSSGLTYGTYPRRYDLSPEELNQELPTIILQLVGDETLNRKALLDYNVDDPTKMSRLAASIDPDHPYDVLLAITPSHYMERDSSGDYYTMGYYLDAPGDQAVLGANTMMGHDVLFDAEEGAIGFAESHCDYRKLVEDVATKEEKEREEALGNVEGSGSGDGGEKEDQGEKGGRLDGDGSTNSNQNGKEEIVVPSEDTILVIPKGPLPVTSNTVDIESSSSAGVTDVSIILGGLVGVLVAGLGFVAYDRLGGREMMMRRGHGRLSTTDADVEVELTEWDGKYLNSFTIS